ncbi:hypothetical protein CSA37_00710 [Candidatus Fermentibacteria bacterium]|nr:MAG: hypothetical protein CSA37_00710 [Candidatus Fermentibacteria bacterium]
MSITVNQAGISQVYSGRLNLSFSLNPVSSGAAFGLNEPGMVAVRIFNRQRISVVLQQQMNSGSNSIRPC